MATTREGVTTRWAQFLAEVQQRQGTLTDIRQQHWALMRECSVDVALSAELPLYDALRARAQLYRAFEALGRGCVQAWQVEQGADRLARVVAELKSRGLLEESFSL